MKKTRNPHIGGQQLPLIVPDSNWKPPTELPDLRGRGKIDLALDTETKDDGLSAKMGPSWYRKGGFICGVSAAWEGGSFYAPVRHPEGDCVDRDALIRWLTDHMNDPNIRLIFMNAGYDLGWIQADFGIPPPAYVDDVGGMAVMIDENRLTYTLDSLCKWRGLPGKDETILREAAAAYGIDPKKDLWQLPARLVGAYATQDPVSTLALANNLRPVLEEDGVLRAYELEMNLIPMVLEMRRRGVRVNLDRAEESKDLLLHKRDEVLEQIGKQLGKRVNIDDCHRAQVVAGWFEMQKLTYPRTAPTKGHPNGQPSFQAKWMRKHQHWLPKAVARAEQLHDAAEKFLQGFIIDYAHKGRLHASINQWRGTEEGEEYTKGTRSHRFSYADPPLQQMPGRDEELTDIVRGVFDPEEGESWGAADYSQQEYRLIVHYAAAFGLPGALAAVQRYVEDPTTDFHEYVVELTGLERRQAKDTNFAKAYGAQVPKFAEMINKSEEEAQEIYDKYDEELPFVGKLNEECERLAASRGYIKLLDGARSHFDFWECWKVTLPNGGREFLRSTTRERAEIWAANIETMHGVRPRLRRSDTRKSMNRLIQGGAARQMKMAMLECWREDIVPLLQMHDELSLSLNDERIGERVREIMRSIEADKLRVPMLVDIEYGVNWGRARKIKDKAGKVVYDASWKAAQAERRLAA